MGKGGRKNARVLVAYGSESGNSQRHAQNIVKRWQKEGTEATFTIKSGNEVKLDELKDHFDVIMIATSSYGEGDPPDNIAKLMLNLLRASAAKESPLAGIQHGVLGFGSSVYETYMNTPRLMDKLLEECGSRRMLQRAELDEGSENDPDAEAKRFEKEMFSLLQALPSATEQPVCKWTVPESKILEKTEADLNMIATSDEGMAALPLIIGGVAVVGAAVAWQMGMLEGIL